LYIDFLGLIGIFGGFTMAVIVTISITVATTVTTIYFGAIYLMEIKPEFVQAGE
jgi:hypothetical protein